VPGFFKRLFGTTSGPTADCIVPRIKNHHFLAALRERGVPEDQMPVTRPLVADLLVTFAFDLPDSFQMVSEADVSERGLTKEKLWELAVDNLRKRMPQIGRQGDPPLMQVVTGENLEACVLLLDEFWRNLASQIPGKVVVSVPHRDVVLVTSSKSEAGLKQIRETTAEVFGQDDVHSLSTTLLSWMGENWEVFD